MTEKRLIVLYFCLGILLLIIGLGGSCSLSIGNDANVSNSNKEIINESIKYDTIVNQEGIIFLKKSDNDWVLKYKTE
jgi:hypothetical protein